MDIWNFSLCSNFFFFCIYLFRDLSRNPYQLSAAPWLVKHLCKASVFRRSCEGHNANEVSMFPAPTFDCDIFAKAIELCARRDSNLLITGLLVITLEMRPVAANSVLLSGVTGRCRKWKYKSCPPGEPSVPSSIIVAIPFYCTDNKHLSRLFKRLHSC